LVAPEKLIQCWCLTYDVLLFGNFKSVDKTRAVPNRAVSPKLRTVAELKVELAALPIENCIQNYYQRYSCSHNHHKSEAIPCIAREQKLVETGHGQQQTCRKIPELFEVSVTVLATMLTKGKRYGYRRRIGKNNPITASGCSNTFGKRPLCCQRPKPQGIVIKKVSVLFQKMLVTLLLQFL